MPSLRSIELDPSLVNQPFDFAMCLALMILFKEHSKQERSSAWQECIDYSAVWTQWAYASMQYSESDHSLMRLILGGDFTVTTTTVVTKLEDIPTSKTLRSGVTIDGYSYKRGDLAVPADTMPALLDLVGLTVRRQGRLIDDTGFRTLSGQDASFARPRFSGFQAEINRIQQAGSARSVDYADVILGVGNNPGNAGFEAYDNITHWVYVPAKPKSKPGSTEIKCWTWGGERDFWSYMTDDRGYYPAYAIYSS